jgi:hypothetical protein
VCVGGCGWVWVGGWVGEERERASERERDVLTLCVYLCVCSYVYACVCLFSQVPVSSRCVANFLRAVISRYKDTYKDT